MFLSYLFNLIGFFSEHKSNTKLMLYHIYDQNTTKMYGLTKATIIFYNRKHVENQIMNFDTSFRT